jgi:hypothetical protein
MVYDDGCKSYLQEYNQIVVNIDYIHHLRKVLCKKDLTRYFNEDRSKFFIILSIINNKDN